MAGIVLWIAILIIKFSLVVVEDYDLYTYNEPTTDLTTEGRKQYNSLQENVKSTQYGSCWRDAIKKLHSGCKSLTEDVQRQLAFDFANCFLMNSGRRSMSCPTSRNITRCLSDADSASFSAYQSFFLHTQNICFYLRTEIWQEGTKEVISKLTVEAHQVAEHLEKSGEAQNRILLLQEQTYSVQNKIIEQGQALGETFESSRLKAAEAIREFEKNTKEQRTMILDVFDRVSQLQKSVFSFFSGIDAFIFYIIALILSYLLTLPAQTAGARIVVFILWMLNMVIESQIERPDMTKSNHATKEEEYYFYIKLWRKVTSVLVFLSLVYAYKQYKDYNYLSYLDLKDVKREIGNLKEVKKEIHELKFYMMNLTAGTSISSNYAPQLIDYDSDSQYDSTFVGSSSSEEDDSLSEAETTCSNLSLTPYEDASDSFGSRYNLRSRSSTPKANPVIERETPKMFARLVKSPRRF